MVLVGLYKCFSLLLFLLPVLTIGVVYTGVTEFLGKTKQQRRIREVGSKKAVRTKAGPRGFGQKIRRLK